MAEEGAVIAIVKFDGAYRYLSNFWPCHVPFAGMEWPSAEHAYQGMKTVYPGEREAVRCCLSSGDAKRAGRQLTLRPGWEDMKKAVMLSVLIAKFTASPDLAAQLAATGDARLSEGNTWHDNFWGHCTCGRPACQRPGENALGQLLEAVRYAVS